MRTRTGGRPATLGPPLRAVPHRLARLPVTRGAVAAFARESACGGAAPMPQSPSTDARCSSTAIRTATSTGSSAPVHGKSLRRGRCPRPTTAESRRTARPGLRGTADLGAGLCPFGQSLQQSRTPHMGHIRQLTPTAGNPARPVRVRAPTTRSKKTCGFMTTHEPAGQILLRRCAARDSNPGPAD